MKRYVVGSEVSHFRLEERLGAGASGEVFRATDLHLGRMVALKFLTQFEDSQQRESFLREARLAASLMHPNIAVIYEIGWDGEAPFLAMELVDGEMLSRRIRSGGVSRAKAFRLMKQILEALEEAHSRGIVHGDIKSSNILVTPRDQIKILDFGLARDIHSARSGVSDPMGTLEFLAPEVARGEPVDRRSDLFSAAVVFYHMLAGRLPFERESQVGTYTAVLYDRAIPLSLFQTDVPEQLDAVIQKALAKDPIRRYQDAREFLEELESLETTPLSRPIAGGPISVAILYFDRIGESEESEYLRLGITEDIITELSRVAGLRIVSRHAVQKYKDRSFDVREIARDLQIHYALHGTVQTAGDRIRVSVQLIDGSKDQPVWAERFDRRLEDIFELQDEVSTSITAALRIRLTDSEQRSMLQRSTENLQAYEHFLRGRYHFSLYNAENNRKAELMFCKSIELDAAYAPAHAALSETYIQRYYNWFDRDRKWLSKAQDVIETACRLNDELPEVHCTLGMLLYLRGDYEAAMVEIQKAIRMDPHYALAHDHTGEIYLHVGELDKAIVAFHTELRINADVIYPYFYLVWLHSLMGDFAMAQEVLDRAKIVHSKNSILSALEGTLASYKGDHLQARELLGKAISVNPSNSFAMGRLAVSCADEGDFPEAIRWIERATEIVDPMDHHAAFDRACVMALKSDTAGSLEWLHRAVDLGWRCGFQYQNEKKLSAVRLDPGFQQIRDRLGWKSK